MDADFFMTLQVNQAGDERRNRKLGNRMDPRDRLFLTKMSFVSISKNDECPNKDDAIVIHIYSKIC